jgi:hypothetical protein
MKISYQEAVEREELRQKHLLERFTQRSHPNVAILLYEGDGQRIVKSCDGKDSHSLMSVPWHELRVEDFAVKGKRIVLVFPPAFDLLTEEGFENSLSHEELHAEDAARGIYLRSGTIINQSNVHQIRPEALRAYAEVRAYSQDLRKRLEGTNRWRTDSTSIEQELAGIASSLNREMKALVGVPGRNTLEGQMVDDAVEIWKPLSNQAGATLMALELGKRELSYGGKTMAEVIDPDRTIRDNYIFLGEEKLKLDFPINPEILEALKNYK